MLSVDDLRTFSLPLDPYRLSDLNLVNSSKAKKGLVEQCMSRFGFQYRVPQEPQPVVVGYERRYGMADRKSASERGYHVPPEAELEHPELAPAALAVLLGNGQSVHGGQEVPEGGCTQEAEKRISVGAPQIPNERLGIDLSMESYDKTLSDSRVQKAFADWSACMKRDGRNYTDPFKAVNDPQFTTPTATPQEILVATADVRCKHETNLINVMASVETAYQQQALEKHAEALSVIKQNFTEREKNAAAILATDS
ncbi:hypothetical protein AB0D32_03675 [Micromonospora sp. NPDC048170]|uniref:hypothetical protein n=1 Tax=Micromonospora sp. NPDC048170 TaxID=3154819 RepID=UPI0033C53F8D